MEPVETPHSPKWPKWLALLFLLLYAIFWSLGPFFSTTLLALAGYFSFLTLYTSLSVREFFKSLFSSVRPPPGPRFAPRPTFRPQPEPGAEPPAYEVIKKAARIVRLVMVGIASLVFILFLIGIFLPDDEKVPVAEETESTETDQSDQPDQPASQVEYFTEKGNTASNYGLTDSAHYYYDAALRLDPQNVYALYNKGLAYIMSGDYSRGNALARRCLRYHSDYDQARWLLGFSYDKMNYADSALYCLEEANAHGYSDPGFLQLLGEVYEKNGRKSNALETYKKLVSVDTTKADVFRKLAELDPEHASEYLKKAAALEK